MAVQEQNKKGQVETAPAKPGSTQYYIDIDHFEEGILVMKDGSMRMVLSTSSVNFELKSELERNGIIYGYQSFLNSLDFPIQILVQSRRLDLDGYLAGLAENSKKMTNELLKVQIRDYILFVQAIIQQTNIMQKRFYVVIPHYPNAFRKAGVITGNSSAGRGAISIGDFSGEKKYIIQKAETVAMGLQGVGVRAIQLDTQELIELFYGVYNPEQITRQKLVDASDFEAEIIEKMPREMEIG